MVDSRTRMARPWVVLASGGLCGATVGLLAAVFMLNTALHPTHEWALPVGGFAVGAVSAMLGLAVSRRPAVATACTFVSALLLTVVLAVGFGRVEATNTAVALSFMMWSPLVAGFFTVLVRIATGSPDRVTRVVALVSSTGTVALSLVLAALGIVTQ